MSDPARQQSDSAEIVHPVRWLGSAWERIEDAAQALTEREHIKHNPVDVIREGTLRYVDELLAEKAATENRRRTDLQSQKAS
jgi:hypothetical protein